MKPLKDRNAYCCIYHVELNELKFAFNLLRTNNSIHMMFNFVTIIVEMYVAMMDSNTKYHVWYVRVSFSCGKCAQKANMKNGTNMHACLVAIQCVECRN